MIAVKLVEQSDMNGTVTEKLEEYQKSRHAKSETRANRFKQSRPAVVGKLFDQRQKEEGEEDDWLDEKIENFAYPPEHDYALAIKTTKLEFILFMKTKEDRDIFVHETYNICQNISKKIELMTARQ